MKRIVGILAGVAGLGIVGGVLWCASSLLAQAPPAAPAPAAAQPLRTRIGLVNFMHVVKGYKKAQAFQDYVTKQGQEIDKQMEPKRARLIQLRAELQKPETPAAKREEMEKELKKLQWDLEQTAEDIRKQMAKQNGDMVVMLYKEVQDAVQVFARAKDIELVMQYSDADPSNPAEYYNPRNVDRKISVGATMPLYMAPGIDITPGVVDMLNQKYQASAAQPPAAPAAPAAPGATAPRQ